MRCTFEDAEYGGVMAMRHRHGVIRAVGLTDFAPTALENWVGQGLLGFMRRHVCIGAKALAGLSDDADRAVDPENPPAPSGLHFSVYPDMGSVASAVMVLTDLEDYYAHSDRLDPVKKTLALVFPSELVASQAEFAPRYWRFAQILSDLSCLTHPWDSAASPDPAAPTFELSLAGRAVFTTTLHPASPRIARRFMYPTWVMNQTRQFDALRAAGQFSRWQDQIRAADAAVDPSGVANPVLTDHGQASAAGQLAGSSVEGLTFSAPAGASDAHARGLAALEQAHREGAPRSVLDTISARLG